jgi:hypothetical protein
VQKKSYDELDLQRASTKQSQFARREPPRRRWAGRGWRDEVQRSRVPRPRGRVPFGGKSGGDAQPTKRDKRAKQSQFAGAFPVASFKCQVATAEQWACASDFPHTPSFQYSIIPILHHSTIPVAQANVTVSGTPRPGAGLLDAGKCWHRGEYRGTMTRRNRQGRRSRCRKEEA